MYWDPAHEVHAITGFALHCGLLKMMVVDVYGHYVYIL